MANEGAKDLAEIAKALPKDFINIWLGPLIFLISSLYAINKYSEFFKNNKTFKCIPAAVLFIQVAIIVSFLFMVFPKSLR